jgi:hypothetical protein
VGIAETRGEEVEDEMMMWHAGANGWMNATCPYERTMMMMLMGV